MHWEYRVRNIFLLVYYIIVLLYVLSKVRCFRIHQKLIYLYRIKRRRLNDIERCFNQNSILNFWSLFVIVQNISMIRRWNRNFCVWIQINFIQIPTGPLQLKIKQHFISKKANRLSKDNGCKISWCLLWICKMQSCTC